jgi:hypothetical protein
MKVARQFIAWNRLEKVSVLHGRYDLYPVHA